MPGAITPPETPADAGGSSSAEAAAERSEGSSAGSEFAHELVVSGVSSEGFTLHVCPPVPPRLDAQVGAAYLVAEAGVHTLVGGNNVLIAGSTALEAEPLSLDFDGHFRQTPSLFATLHLSVEEEDTSEDTRARKAQLPKGALRCGQATPSGYGVQLFLPDASEQPGVAEALQEALIKDGAVVGWVACECEGGNGALSGMVELGVGGWEEIDVAMGVEYPKDYPEPPVLLSSLAGLGMSWPRPGAHLLHALNDGVDGGTSRVRCAGIREGETEQAAWLIMPAGSIYALGGSMYSGPA